MTEKQKFLEDKLEDLWGELKYAVEMNDVLKELKEHYKDKVSSEYHHRLVIQPNKKRKYSYGYDITFFVGENGV